MNVSQETITGLEIAIIGMAGRFPGAPTVNDFWQNMLSGRESLAKLDDEFLRSQGVSEADLANPNYVKVGGRLDKADHFDRHYFGYSPREAEIVDPQQRLFLQTASDALEIAGYDPERFEGPIGVFGGAGMNGYLLNLYGNSRIRSTSTPYELFVGNDKDFLTTRVSYKLNLRGPSMSVQTACSSSLVAVHMACQSLIGGDCDMALAGGVAVSKQIGYLSQEGSIFSSDGHCRPFDAAASGTVGGNGVGIVVLKRLSDALADGDTIDAVVKGSAVTNDGALKVSFTAPQVEMQAAAIRNALDVAEVSADSISYVEAHGTGTPIGDPIELAALTKAYRSQTDRNGYCALGSVKSNIGHLDTAAGVAGLIRTVLALKHKQIPATLHYREPNPQIEFASSPFYVNGELTDWDCNGRPRRAGVSSFGIGGTNAHVILEEHVPVERQTAAVTCPPAVPQLLPVSAKSPEALSHAVANLTDFLLENVDCRLEDVAYTLQEGRRICSHRAVIVVDGPEHVGRVAPKTCLAKETPSVVFLFPGQGAQYQGMETPYYQAEPLFKQAFDECKTLFDAESAQVDAESAQVDGELNHSIERDCFELFACEYSLAKLFMHYGIRPVGMLGHSFGEIVAACLAGVFDLKQALWFVRVRSQLIDQMPTGAMTTVASSPKELSDYFDAEVAIAAENAPQWTTLSGPIDKIEALENKLRKDGIGLTRLQTSYAFHSASMELAAEKLIDKLARLTLNKPEIPFLSGVTGRWITDQEATSPEYWGRQMRQTVRFRQCAETLMEIDEMICLELGPGKSLSTFLRQCSQAGSALTTIQVDRGSGNDKMSGFRTALAELWSWGGSIDWAKTRSLQGALRRISLPTYPFETKPYRVEPDNISLLDQHGSAPSHDRDRSSKLTNEWVYRPVWKRVPLTTTEKSSSERDCWLIFCDEIGRGEALAKQVEQSGDDVIRVRAGDGFAQAGFRQYFACPGNFEDAKRLLKELAERQTLPTQIVYFWPLGTVETASDQVDVSTRFVPFLSLLVLVRAIPETMSAPLQLSVITSASQDVLGTEVVNVSQAELRGLCQVVTQEYPLVGCRQIDLDSECSWPPQMTHKMERELRSSDPSTQVAYRGLHRWTHDYEPVQLPKLGAGAYGIGLREGGTYFLLGDLDSAVGQAFARGIIQQYQARLVGIDTSPNPRSSEAAGERIDQFANAAPLHVLYRADVKDPDAVVEAIRVAVAEHGNPHGIFVCSPTTNEQSMSALSTLGAAQCEYNHASKLMVLERLVAAISTVSPDFVFVQSSMSSVLGGIGLGAYSAGNHAIDAFVAQRNVDGTLPWFSVNWGRIDLENKADDEHSLSLAEVWEVTEEILNAGNPGQFAVSKSSLGEQLARWVSGRSQPISRGSHGVENHVRPKMTTEYVAPKTDVEQAVANIWQEMLGIDRVGVDDNFFELGGHSLLAIRIIAKLRDAFPIEIELRHLITDNPTVAHVAEAIEQELPKVAELNQMADMLNEIQAMTPAEVNAKLKGPPEQG